jgi:hypothetical protein
MEVTLVDQDKHDKLNKDDEIINTYSSTYTGSSGTGVSMVKAKVVLSSEDKAALDRFGKPDIKDRQELTLKDITNLGDFTEDKKPGEED